MKSSRVKLLQFPGEIGNLKLNALMHVPFLGAVVNTVFTSEHGISSKVAAIDTFLACNWARKIICDREYVPAIMNGDLVTEGPYKEVRHPLYAMQRTSLVGMEAIAPTTIGIALTAGYFGLSEILARREEKTNQKRFGREYEEYIENTPRWIPKRVNEWLERRATEYQPIISTLRGI